ncbi:MAG: SH3 domain-containing protein [Anaerolineae bacterium]|nr:SH3 domain-containing protein [Anaerolineae bacterium]
MNRKWWLSRPVIAGIASLILGLQWWHSLALFRLSSTTTVLAQGGVTPTFTPRFIRFKGFVATLQADLKAAPRPDAATVARVQGGQSLDMVGRSDPPGWILVIYPPDSEGRAWIAVDQLRIYSNLELLPIVKADAAILVQATPTATVTITAAMAPVAARALPTMPAGALSARVTADILNVRAGPGTNYAILGKLRGGDQVQITGRNEAGTWLQVVYSATASKPGWISAVYAEVSGDLTKAPVATTTAQPLAPTATPQRRSSAFTGKLALLTNSGGELYLVNADGSNLHRVTAGVLDPDLSPDGSRIAYARWPGGPDPEGIYVRDLTNDNEWRQWGTHLPRTPDWSPDGRYLVFAFQKGGREGYEELKFEFFQGGRRFTFTYLLPPDPNWRLGHVDTWTGEYRDVPSLAYASNPSWAPDGQRIIYHDNRGFEVTTLSGPSRAINQEVRYRNPVWSPAGGLIAFEYVYPDHTDIYVMNEDGSGVRQLTFSDPLARKAVNNVSPTWSPDGQWIAFLTDRSGRWEVYVMRPDGSEQQPLFPSGLPNIVFQHSTAGERLLSWSR